VTGEALGETGRKPLQRIGLADMGVVGTGRRAHLEPVKTAARTVAAYVTGAGKYSIDARLGLPGAPPRRTQAP
jgi:hypothetical protein